MPCSKGRISRTCDQGVKIIYPGEITSTTLGNVRDVIDKDKMFPHDSLEGSYDDTSTDIYKRPKPIGDEFSFGGSVLLTGFRIIITKIESSRYMKTHEGLLTIDKCKQSVASAVY